MADSKLNIAEELKAFGRSELDRLKSILITGSDHSRMVGRILRAHLLVEVTMRRQLEVTNPRLGSLEPLALSFDRLRRLFFQSEDSLPWAAGPVAALNKIRNKFAHRLDARVTDEDVEPFVAFVREMYLSPEKMVAVEADVAVMIEVFATIFGLLSGASTLVSRRRSELDAEILREYLGRPNENSNDGV